MIQISHNISFTKKSAKSTFFFFNNSEENFQNTEMSQGCQAKDDWLWKCHLPGFEFPILVAAKASSVFNAEWKRHMRMLRCYCLQLLSNAVEVFSKSVDSTKRRRTRKHALLQATAVVGYLLYWNNGKVTISIFFIQLCGLLLLSSFWTRHALFLENVHSMFSGTKERLATY